MWQRWIGLLLVIFVVLSAAPVQAAESVHPIELYQQTVKVENMIRQADAPAKVLAELDALSDMYTRLQVGDVHQRIEGVQAISAELVGLKAMYAAAKGPEQAVAEFRIHRVTVAFDSLAYPNSPAWLPIARSLENHLDKSIEAVGKGDQKAAKTMFAKARQERDQIWLAMQLHGDPSELNLQVSAHRFVEGQIAMEQMTDKQGCLDSLGAYKASVGKVSASIQMMEEPPLLPVLHVTLTPWTYGSLGSALMLLVGWRVLRKKKN